MPSFDTEIHDVMKDLGHKDWSVRFRSLEKMQVLIADHQDQPHVWTKEILIALHKPLMAQLKDLRSSIVREVGKTLADLSQALGNSYSVLGRYLVETQLNVLGAGNKVITDYVDESLQSILQNAHIKNAIQIIDRIGGASKSSIVREKCNLYMALVLENWDISAIRKHEATIVESVKRGISDASSQARKEARRCFVALAPISPEAADKVLRVTDQRTQKALRALIGKPAGQGKGQTKGGTGTGKHSPTAAAMRGGGGGGAASASGGRLTSHTSSPKSAGSSNASSPTAFSADFDTLTLDLSKRDAQAPTDSDPGATYRTISPKFHGVEPSQDDLVAKEHDHVAVPLRDTQEDIVGDAEAIVHAVGDRVWVESGTDPLPGTVRFTGNTEFAGGVWIGIELDGNEGRNDGSVQGIRYFSCQSGKGLFKRPPAVVSMTSQEIIEMRSSQPALAAAASGASSPLRQEKAPPKSQQLGFQILAAHRCHIDDVLATLRAEMEELAEFETNSAVFDRDFVQNYVNAVKRRVSHRMGLQQQIMQDIANFEDELATAPN